MDKQVRQDENPIAGRMCLVSNYGDESVQRGLRVATLTTSIPQL